MTDPALKYTRLVRSRSGLDGLGALFLGPDHLLVVRNTFTVEHYRRWYYKDIQAVLVRRNAKRLVWNLVVGGGALVLALGAVASLSAPATAAEDKMFLAVFGWFCAILALGCLAIALVNSIMGPGCTVHIQTLHGVEKLPLPGRMGTFRAVAARLEPLIFAAQANAAAQETSPASSPEEPVPDTGPPGKP